MTVEINDALEIVISDVADVLSMDIARSFGELLLHKVAEAESIRYRRDVEARRKAADW